MFTTESVTAGHPDKLADQISDAILDAALTHDPHARTGIEVLMTPGRVTVAGEVTTTTHLDVPVIARQALTRAGYHAAEYAVTDHLIAQSPDIAQGVDNGGAGDQGIMFGYAIDAPGYLPGHLLATHALARAIHEDTPHRFGPDGKVQLTLDDTGAVLTALVSLQHPETADSHDVRTVVEPLVEQTLEEHELLSAPGYRLLINPTGRFTIGGPASDAGLTGRKIIVDTYGGYARHGGGAFSGKDPSKVDRSAAYAARQAALSLIVNGYARRAEVQLAYAIGVAEPVSIHVDTYGTGDTEVAARALSVIDFTPAGIIDRLDLARPIYRSTATYGHFTDPTAPWEQPLAL